MQKIRVGVVGSGAISDIYLQNCIQRFSVLDVVSISSKRGLSALKKAEQYHLKAVNTDEMMADSSIDLILNLTPVPEHYAILKKALQSGKHVYTEKVITETMKQAMELKKLAEEKELRIGCAPDTFMGGALQTARQLLDQGAIGEVTSVTASVNRDMKVLYPIFRFTTLPGSGIGFDLGIYYLTAILSLLGPVSEVSGMIATRHPELCFEDPNLPEFGTAYQIQNEDTMTALLSFESGVMGTLHFNGNSIFPEMPGIVLYGTEGILRLPDPNQFGGEVLLQKKGMSSSIAYPLTHGFISNSRGVGIADLAWALQTGSAHRASAEMGIHALDVLTSVVKSAKTRTHQIVHTSFVRPDPLPEGYLNDYVGVNEESALV